MRWKNRGLVSNLVGRAETAAVATACGTLPQFAFDAVNTTLDRFLAIPVGSDQAPTAVPNSSAINEPLPGWLTICVVPGLVATEWSFADYGKALFAAEGVGAHATWLALGLSVSTAIGVLLELQVRASTFETVAVAGAQRARLHGVLCGVLGGLAGVLAGGLVGLKPGLLFGSAFGVLSSVPPKGTLDLLARGRLGLLGLLFALASAVQVARLTAAAQLLYASHTVADWVAGAGAVVGLVAVAGAGWHCAWLAHDALRPGVSRLDRSQRLLVPAATVCLAHAAANLAGRLFAAPAPYAGSGLIIGGAMLAWALLARLGPTGDEE